MFRMTRRPQTPDPHSATGEHADEHEQAARAGVTQRPATQTLSACPNGLSAPIHISVRGGTPIRADSISIRQVKRSVISVATIGAKIVKRRDRFDVIVLFCFSSCSCARDTSRR